MTTASDIPPAAGKRGPGRPKGYPKTGGRQKGTRNAVTADVRETILARGKPVELLCDVARGVKIRVGPQAGPGEPEFVYPSLKERVEAARVLLAKIAPDLRAQEVTGADGAPLMPERDLSDIELARRVAFMLTSAAPEADETPAEPEARSLGAEAIHPVTAAPPREATLLDPPRTRDEALALGRPDQWREPRRPVVVHTRPPR